MADLSVTEQRRNLLAWLDDAEGVSTVLRETHVSVLAFSADRVWKCKKAVQFPFIDLSTLERRRVNCEREVALNRRLAPEVYVGVVPLEAHGMIVDYLVEMRRLPDDRRLAAVIGRDARGGETCVDAIADLLVGFHAGAQTGGDIDGAATTSALTALWTRSIDELRVASEGVLDPATIDRIERRAAVFLAGRDTLFSNRIAEHRIRDGHGDLLADDVFCLAEGPQALDCLEFDDRLRFGDVLADVGFLAMDLEYLDRRDLASRLIERYRTRSGDAWPMSLEHFYIAYRALIRAKVAALRVAEEESSARAARALVHLAATHLDQGRVRLVLIGGAPASGKTTTARELAGMTGWTVLRSDVTRKRLAGLEPAESAAAPLGEGLYSPAWTDRTYAAMLDDARRLLQRGESVILDASWSTRDRRRDAEVLTAETASALTSFVCEVPPEVATARAAARAEQRTDASDAGPAIAAELRVGFDAWPEAVRLDTSMAPDHVVRHVLTELELL